MSFHVLRVPTRVVSERPDGEPRWCFYCRKHVGFIRTVQTPIDPMSYYGPHASIKTTYDLYAHLSLDDAAADLDLVEA